MTMCIDRPPVTLNDVVRVIQPDLTCAVRCDAPVLITGDSGPINEDIAGMIHRGSRRAAGRFLTVDCASTTDSLLELKLFGRARGRVPGLDRDTRGVLEQADGGTILLENVGALGPALQVRLSRFLENGQIRRVGADQAHTLVDVRVIASADHDLFSRVDAGRFSRHLYYQLNVVHLLIPSAQRPDDQGGMRGHSTNTEPILE
jgi:DNA-binding NtrC family response regulator